LSPDGAIEIGYSVAASRRRRGHASAAVSAMIECTPALGARSLTAATAFDNLASQRVLERNGFACVGTRSDPDDGPLRLWRRPVSGPEQSDVIDRASR
jgi:RimJ/RimL family protein N-acetyltransferase